MLLLNLQQRLLFISDYRVSVFCVHLSAKLDYSEEDYDVMPFVHSVYRGGAGTNIKSENSVESGVL